MRDVSFMHYRILDAHNNIECRGGATLAIREVGNEMIIGVAVCHPDDVFSRRLGRLISEGRLNKFMTGGENPNIFVFPRDVEVPLKEDAHSYMREQMEKLDVYA